MVARRHPLDDEFLRLRLLGLIMFLFLAFLGSVLWYFQVAHVDRYESSQSKQSIRRVRLPGVRGLIFDREGRRLADNRPSYDVALYLEELRQPGSWKKTIDHVEGLIDRLSDALGRPPELSREEIRSHVQKRLPLPLLAWQDIDEETLARLHERLGPQPGVDVYIEPVRTYPEGNTAGHLLGYVGRADLATLAEEESEDYHYYLPEWVGRSGLERRFDDLLRGEAGGRLVRVDVTGYRREDVGQREPQAGSDIKMAVDARIQRMAEQALGDVAGACVVLDPRNGDVLALVSSPGFDPNSFTPVVPTALWREMLADERKPLLNRAISERYAPGSTFKPVTLISALESGKLSPDQTYECPGYFQLGRAVFRCWNHAGHGTVSITRALEQSCNVYCFHAGLQGGYDAIYHTALALGLGRRTGIELDGETPGLLPDDAWKMRTYSDHWRDGDTCNVSIGQGALATSPLQMAVVAATLANGGRVYRPRLLLGVRAPGQEAFEPRPPELVNEMHWSPRNVELVRRGMRDVVNAPTGTGRAIRLDHVTVAGKTGTAEFGPKEGRQRHAWMIAFAPYEMPRYAVAMVVDEGISGSETAAPRMKVLLSGLFAPPPTEEGGA